MELDLGVNGHLIVANRYVHASNGLGCKCVVCFRMAKEVDDAHRKYQYRHQVSAHDEIRTHALLKPCGSWV